MIISVKYILTKRTWVRSERERMKCESVRCWQQYRRRRSFSSLQQVAARYQRTISSCILHSAGYCSCTRQMKASASDQVTRDISWLPSTISRSNRVNLLYFQQCVAAVIVHRLYFLLTYLLFVILSCWEGMTECWHRCIIKPVIRFEYQPAPIKTAIRRLNAFLISVRIK